MESETGNTIVGFMMGVLGLVGLILASGAHDDEMYVFGWALAGFAALFVFGLIKSHYDRLDRLSAIRVQSDDHV